MKRIFLILALAVTTIGFSQSPEKMSYQAVVRDGNGDLMSNTSVSMQISILQNSATGSAIYVETHSPTTNINGLVTLEIGTGAVVTGTFSEIDWGADTYFIKIETDLTGGTNYSISGTSQLLSVPYALHAKTADNVSNYKIGDFAHGGIVFWVDESGQHGLVCAKIDQSALIRWRAKDAGFHITHAKGNGVYAGEANNSIIISTQTALGDDGDVYAARLCNELEIIENTTTYGDWYLPSKFELSLMFQNASAINTAATANGGANLLSDVYWSSTENSINNAWVVNLSDGVSSAVFKSIPNPVRAIRSF